MKRLCLFSVAAGLCALIASAQAQSDESLKDQILGCASVSAPADQLVCYNALAARLKGVPKARTSAVPQAPAATPMPAASAPPAENPAQQIAAAPIAPPTSPPAAATRRDFGADSMPFNKDAPKAVDQMTAKVKSVAFNYFHRFTVTLQNGQVWRQEDSDTNVASFDADRTDLVTIKRGFLDSFHLSIDGKWGSFAVRRIK